LNDARFAAALGNRRTEIVAAAVARVQRLVEDAVDTLADLLRQTTDLPVRHKVATQILELAGVVREDAGDIGRVFTAQEIQSQWDDDAVDRETAAKQAAADRKLRQVLASFVDSANGGSFKYQWRDRPVTELPGGAASGR
jgi:hypothetical protein